MQFLVPTRPAPLNQPPARRLLEPVLRSADQPALPLEEVETQALPELDPALHRLAWSIAVAVVETLAGQRSLHQLGAWLSTRVRDRLDHLCRTQAAPGLRLRSIRVQQPHGSALEIAAVLTLDGRCRAAALRLDRWGGRWLVTGLEISLRLRRIRRARER